MQIFIVEILTFLSEEFQKSGKSGIALKFTRIEKKKEREEGGERERREKDEGERERKQQRSSQFAKLRYTGNDNKGAK